MIYNIYIKSLKIIRKYGTEGRGKAKFSKCLSFLKDYGRQSSNRFPTGF